MNSTRLKSLIFIFGLIAITGAAMAYSSGAGRTWLAGLFRPAAYPTRANAAPLQINGHLVQNKVLQGSSGIVNMALTLTAAEDPEFAATAQRNVDMVIVLDRSGSMNGRKISDARQAVLNLLSSLSPKDRFALITYSEGAQVVSNLQPVSAARRHRLTGSIAAVTTGGGTNLGAGLKTGIDVLLSGEETGNARKLVLISDGLANKGITDVSRLGGMAGIAVEKVFAISTVGVGNEFNEHLMTAIADRGAGNYYYLENPMAFSEVFQKELFYTQATVATNVSIWVPRQNGISLTDAAGYPITRQNKFYIFYPGDLHSGQTRKVYLTLQVPTESTAHFDIDRIRVRYRFKDQVLETTLAESFQIACVGNKKEVQASIDKTSWAEKVLQEDYNRLKQEVAVDIKAGRRQSALNKIHRYHLEQETINAKVGSTEVSHNLDRDLKELRQRVEDTFEGTPTAVSRKQKSSSKALQYEGYRGRR
jgi:Ca-activated chloride channel family protein